MKKKEEILGLIRHVLTFGGGYAVSSGLLDLTSLETVVGALVTVIGIGWSVLEKIATRKTVESLESRIESLSVEQ
jgi:hypothetical protein